jgi:catechol 2,3-dioxygenase-like lactoylglutathione lyase family enzyme
MALVCALSVCASIGLAQAPAPPAPSVGIAGTTLQAVWHLGRITGDLDRIVRFYHDLLGLDLRGAADQPRLFALNPTINEFVGAPPQAEFRAAFLPIPGASPATEPQNQIYQEAFEYRNVDRHQLLPPLVSPGVSILRFVVRDLDKTLAAMKTAGVTIVTTGAEAVVVPTPLGLQGAARAVMVRDPDGYPVELMQLTPPPSTFAPPDRNVLGAHTSVVVRDTTASLDFYRRLIGGSLQTWAGSGWQTNKAFSQVRGIPAADYRATSLLLPGATGLLELVQFRGVEQTLRDGWTATTQGA